MRKKFLCLVFWWLAATGCQPPAAEPAAKLPATAANNTPATAPAERVEYVAREELPQQLSIQRKVKKEPVCPYEDGSHTASIDYHNPKTGHKTTYEFKVTIRNCAVIRIDFPNGGWLDEDHIPATTLDKRGDAKFTDDKGRNWRLHLKLQP